MKFKKLISILLALSLILTISLLTSCNTEEEEQTEVAQTEEQTEATVRVIKAKHNIKKGTILSAKDIEIVDVLDVDLPEGYAKSSSEVINRKLTEKLSKGDIITTAKLSTKVYAEEKVELDVALTEARILGYVIITDYLDSNTGKDISAEIQKVIDENPRKTIYFPDGEYIIANPIKTSSNSKKAVSLHLAANAVIKASENWAGRDTHMIHLGAIDETFTIDATGTNYYMYGGVVDGSGFVKGVVLEGGRETSIRNVTIKNVPQGLHVVYNEEYTSNDSDTEWVTIEGNGASNSIGLIIDGFDNTFSNMRISGFQTGVQVTKPGNLMHDIYVKNLPSENIDYNVSKGFIDTGGGNWYDACRADNYRTAFYISGSSISILKDCHAYWSENRGSQYAIETDGRFSATVAEFRADFVAGNDNVLLVAASNVKGNGIIKNPMFNKNLAPNNLYEKFLVGKIVWSN